MPRTPTLPRRGLAALAALPLLPAAALGQSAPPAAESRPLRLVVPFPPGGALDLLARLLAERLGPALGRTVLVDNRAGAGGVLGADAVAKAAPDGATIGLLGLTTWTAMPFMFSRLPFDPAKDFTPLSLISAGSLLCVVNAETAASRGWSDFRALIAWARANPDKVTMGSSGTGTSSHLCLAAVNKATGAGILHVPYRGGGPAIQDLLSGNIDMMFDVMPALMPHVASGKLKALAVSPRRGRSIRRRACRAWRSSPISASAGSISSPGTPSPPPPACRRRWPSGWPRRCARPVPSRSSASGCARWATRR
ncbi:Bug family tripartite tricarboxylate transporter substrate binding protein [Pseudoroseomonas cervicalis]|uniref:Bug family tripartite tricarboxylate transporter substrate binding protein n=1 Tax=Teichococcus cervicalis TaxID=204525 RepID=UPI0035F001F3